jgi:hypothetical protein
VATLARKLDWASVAEHFRVNWKTIAAMVEGAVLWGLAHRPWNPLHLMGLDEVSRRKGQQYLTLVYDLERGRVVWVVKNRDEATLQRFFAWAGPAAGAGHPGDLLRHVATLPVGRPDRGPPGHSGVRPLPPRAALQSRRR